MALPSSISNPYEALFEQMALMRQEIAGLKRIIQNKAPEYNPNERLTRKQVFSEYKISSATLHRMISREENALPFEKVGRKTLFRREQLEKFFRNNQSN